MLDFLSGDAESQIREIYGGINDVVNNVISILTMSPESNAQIWQMIKSVFNIVLPVGYSIATMFIIISLIGKAALFKLNNYENIVKVFLIVAIGKMILENSFELLAMVYDVAAGLISKVGMAPQSVPDMKIDSLVNQVNSMNWIDKRIAILQLQPISFIMWIIKCGVITIAYGRLIEIYVHIALAPISLATAVSEEYNHIAKKFIQSYAAVCLQGLIMLLVCIIFSALSVQLILPADDNSFMGGGIGFMVSAFVLISVLFKSGSWAKQITGLM